MHQEKHPQSGETVKVKFKTRHPQLEDVEHEYRIENWWDNIAPQSWMFSDGNPACLIYAMRVAVDDLPLDDEVIYGKIGAFGHLVHISEVVT